MRSAARQVLDVAARSLELFSRVYAPYPYTELDIVSTPNLALGIEYPGAFALNERLLTPEEDFTSAPESVLLESTVAHETAHEWFYNLVGNDQLDDPGWTKRWRSMPRLRTTRTGTGPAGRGYARLIPRPVGARRSGGHPIGLPVADYDEGAYGAIIYGRGPLFFMALEEAMGQRPSSLSCANTPGLSAGSWPRRRS